MTDTPKADDRLIEALRNQVADLRQALDASHRETRLQADLAAARLEMLNELRMPPVSNVVDGPALSDTERPGPMPQETYDRFLREIWPELRQFPERLIARLILDEERERLTRGVPIYIAAEPGTCSLNGDRDLARIALSSGGAK